MPIASELTVDIMALAAQEEPKAISASTKAALASAENQGVKLGCAKGAAHLQQYENKLGVEALKRNADGRTKKLADVVKEIQEGQGLQA